MVSAVGYTDGKGLDFGLVRDTSSRCSASSLAPPAKRLDVLTTPHTASQLMHYYYSRPRGVCAAVVGQQESVVIGMEYNQELYCVRIPIHGTHDARRRRGRLIVVRMRKRVVTDARLFRADI